MNPLTGQMAFGVPRVRRRKWREMQERYARLGKREHFASMPAYRADVRDLDWYRQRPEGERQLTAPVSLPERDRRMLRAKRMAEIRRAALEWELAHAGNGDY